MQDLRALTREPLAQVRTFGTPWHGLVRQGVLTLPNGMTRPYPQPSDVQPEEAGTTWLFDRGMPPVTTAPAEEALGMQWRNTAVLAGAQQQYAGMNLDGWVYVSPGGERWLMQPTFGVANVFALANALQLTVLAKRLGELGGVADERTFVLTLSDWGQQGYAPLAGLTGTVSGARLAVTAVQPGGGAAAVMVYERQVAAGGRQDQSVKHPLGWLALTVQGGGATLAMGLQVLRTRAQTLWIAENTWTDGTAPVDLTVGNTGWVIRTANGPRAYTAEVRRLVALWPAAGGGWREVVHRMRDVGQATLATSVVGGGVRIDRTRQATLRHALAVDGVDRVWFELVTNLTQQDTFSESVGNPPFLVRDFVWTGTTQEPMGTLSFNEPGQTGYDPTFEPTPPLIDLRGRVFVDNLRPFLYDGNDAELLSYAHRMGYFATVDASVRRSWVDSGLVAMARWDMCRYSGQVLGFRVTRQAGATPRPTWRSARATPGGAVGGAVAGTDVPAERLYSSWCPQTSQTAALDTVPVCWV